jgi:hypothetical protein
LEAQAEGSSKILRTHIWQAPIAFNEEMEDIEEIGGTSMQSEI